jgi:hypothetical protein
MKKTPRHYRIISSALLIAFSVLLVPAPTYAISISDIPGAVGNSFLSIVLEGANAWLGLFNQILVSAIGLLGGLLQKIIEIDPSGGGAVVYTAWRTLRDMCNMAFIIALILMAFGTIFNSLEIGFLKPYSVMGGRGVIWNFLFAAILLNFSLAIGQTIMSASNQVSNIVIELLPKDISAQIAQQLKYAEVATGTLSAPTPVLLGLPPDTLTPSQQAEARKWPVNQQQLMLQCLNGELAGQARPGERLDTPAGCYAAVLARGPNAPGTATAVTNTYQSLPQGASNLAQWVNSPFMTTAYNLGRKLSSGAKIPSKMATLTGYVFSIIMLSSLLLDFLTVVIFMMIRIPALWILLALSPLAWTALAFPGLRTYENWWKQFWAWNLFSPLYLFVLYLGMLLLQNTNSAVASLGAQNSVFIGSFGVAFQYLIAGIVFVVGTGMVLKASFLGGTIAGTWVGRITAITGVGGASGSFGPIGRFLGTTTGAPAAYKGITGGIGAKYEELVTKPTARRQEEIEARYRGLGGLGDRGAMEALQQKRIKEQMDKNKERNVPIATLRKDLEEGQATLGRNQTPDAKYFAAAKALMDEGELKNEELIGFQKAATALSPRYGQAVRESVQKKFKEKAEKKKFKSDEKGVAEVINLMETMNDDERKKFLGDLERNQPLLRAKLAGNQKIGAMIDKDTGKPLTTSAILEKNASKLSDEELLELYKERKAGTITLGENAEFVLNDRLADRDVKKLLRLADAKTRQDILKDARDQRKAKLRETARGKVEEEKEKEEVSAEIQKEKEEQQTTRATEQAVRMAGGITPERQREMQQELEEFGQARPVRPSARPTPTRPAPPPPSSPRVPVQGGGSTPPRTRSAGTPITPKPRQISLSVSVNGRFRGTTTVPADSTEGTMLQAARGIPAVAQDLQDKTVQRTQYLLGKLNIITT